MDAHVYTALFFVVVFTTFVAYALNSWGLRHVNPSVVGSYIYIQPLAGTLIAVGSGKYTLHWQQVIFGLLIMSGVYLVSVNRSKPIMEDRV